MSCGSQSFGVALSTWKYHGILHLLVIRRSRFPFVLVRVSRVSVFLVSSPAESLSSPRSSVQALGSEAPNSPS